MNTHRLVRLTAHLLAVAFLPLTLCAEPPPFPKRLWPKGISVILDLHETRDVFGVFSIYGERPPQPRPPDYSSDLLSILASRLRARFTIFNNTNEDLPLSLLAYDGRPVFATFRILDSAGGVPWRSDVAYQVPEPPPPVPPLPHPAPPHPVQGIATATVKKKSSMVFSFPIPYRFGVNSLPAGTYVLEGRVAGTPVYSASTTFVIE